MTPLKPHLFITHNAHLSKIAWISHLPVTHSLYRKSWLCLIDVLFGQHTDPCSAVSYPELWTYPLLLTTLAESNQNSVFHGSWNKVYTKQNDAPFIVPRLICKFLGCRKKVYWFKWWHRPSSVTPKFFLLWKATWCRYSALLLPVNCLLRFYYKVCAQSFKKW